MGSCVMRTSLEGRGARALMAVRSVTPADLGFFADAGLSQFWTGPEHWEDLILLSGPRVIFFVCSHEGFGRV